MWFRTVYMYIYMCIYFFFLSLSPTPSFYEKEITTEEDRVDGNIERRGGQGFWIISIVNNDDGLPVERFAAVLFEPEHHGDGIVRFTGLYIAGQSCPLSCHSLYRLHGYCNTRGRGHWKILFSSFFLFFFSSRYRAEELWRGGVTIMRLFEKEKERKYEKEGRVELKKNRRGRGGKREEKENSKKSWNERTASEVSSNFVQLNS